MIEIELAAEFGNALDADDFQRMQQLLHAECVYFIGEQPIRGPELIAASYERNMQEGRRKLDELVWGPSRVERIDDHTFMIFFEDFLTHQGQSHTFQCRQKITFDPAGKIHRIDHIEDADERDRLNDFYRRVGLEN